MSDEQPKAAGNAENVDESEKVEETGSPSDEPDDSDREGPKASADDGTAISEKTEEQKAADDSETADAVENATNSGRPSWNGIERRARWSSAFQAIEYVNAQSRDRLRESDKKTNALLIATLAVVALLFLTPPDYLPYMVLICDLLFGATLLVFILNRLGILGTLSPRQVVLVWDLILGVSLFSIFVVVHLGAKVARPAIGP